DTLVPNGLPETTASIVVVATVVGAAATLLVRRTKSIEKAEVVPTRTCDDCGGSGLCPQCKGERFVLKRLSDGSAEKAGLNAKIWLLDTQQGYQRDGATTRNVENKITDSQANKEADIKYHNSLIP
nr:uncharacterized protein [Tanacetum cinerariifolium]